LNRDAIAQKDAEKALLDETETQTDSDCDPFEIERTERMRKAAEAEVDAEEAKEAAEEADKAKKIENARKRKNTLSTEQLARKSVGVWGGSVLMLFTPTDFLALY